MQLTLFLIKKWNVQLCIAKFYCYKSCVFVSKPSLTLSHQVTFAAFCRLSCALFAVPLKHGLSCCFQAGSMFILISLQICILQWCRARDLLGSQILVTTGGLELRISCIRSRYYTKFRAWHHCSLKLGSKLKYLNKYLHFLFKTTILDKMFVEFSRFSKICLHQKWNRTRLLSNQEVNVWIASRVAKQLKALRRN